MNTNNEKILLSVDEQGVATVTLNNPEKHNAFDDDIIKQLGTKEFTRVRVGILPVNGKPKDVENFVLRSFAKDEEEHISLAIKNAAAGIETILSGGNPS